MVEMRRLTPGRIAAYGAASAGSGIFNAFNNFVLPSRSHRRPVGDRAHGVPCSDG